MAKPNSGKKLVAFLAAEVHTAHGVRKAASQPMAPAAASYVPLTFSESDEEAFKDTQKDNKKKRKAAKILDELLVAEVPKKKRAKDQTIVEKAKTVPDLLTQAGAEEQSR